MMNHLRSGLIALVVCLMLCGCCPGEEDDMSLPNGIPYYGEDLSFIGAGVIATADAYRALTIQPSGWELALLAHGFIYVAGWYDAEFAIPGLPFKNADRSQLWWSNWDSNSTWHKFGEAEYTIAYTSTSITIHAFFGDKEPPGFPGPLYLLIMDGPSAPQGLSPKVTGVSPV